MFAQEALYRGIKPYSRCPQLVTQFLLVPPMETLERRVQVACISANMAVAVRQTRFQLLVYHEDLKQKSAVFIFLH